MNENQRMTRMQSLPSEPKPEALSGAGREAGAKPEKVCTRCRVSKPLEAFSLNRRNKSDGRQPKCKSCFAAYCADNSERLLAQKADYYRQNADRLKMAAAEWQRANPQSARAKKRAWINRNKEAMKQIRRAWVLANPEKVKAATRAYQAKKLLATPAWADRDKMLAVYEEATRLTLETGIEHHVDHIVPLKSKLVCGLHCEANLQVLPRTENIRKSNRVWPDCPSLGR